ncbi:hypothetical protein F4781DRAFT_432711 [Annulohypoxylon bovei var. microspora]|nr:hypothetical protein F4781DRAFT_432711 [Annulohypoxylon bovei var. microspora]
MTSARSMLHGDSPASKSPFAIAPRLGVRVHGWAGSAGADAGAGSAVGLSVGNILDGSRDLSGVGLRVGNAPDGSRDLPGVGFSVWNPLGASLGDGSVWNPLGASLGDGSGVELGTGVEGSSPEGSGHGGVGVGVGVQVGVHVSVEGDPLPVVSPDEVELGNGAEDVEEDPNEVVELSPVGFADEDGNPDDPVPGTPVLVGISHEVHDVFVQRAELLRADQTELLTWLELSEANVDSGIEDDPADDPPDNHELVGVEVLDTFHEDEVELRLPETENVIAAVAVDVVTEVVTERVDDAPVSEALCVPETEPVDPGSPTVPVLVILAVNEEKVDEAEDPGSKVLDTVELNMAEVDILLADVTDPDVDWALPADTVIDVDNVIVAVDVNVIEAVSERVDDAPVSEAVCVPENESVDSGSPTLLVLVILAIDEEMITEAEDPGSKILDATTLDVTELDVAEVDTLLADVTDPVVDCVPDCVLSPKVVVDVDNVIVVVSVDVIEAVSERVGDAPVPEAVSVPENEPVDPGSPTVPVLVVSAVAVDEEMVAEAEDPGSKMLDAVESDVAETDTLLAEEADSSVDCEPSPEVVVDVENVIGIDIVLVENVEAVNVIGTDISLVETVKLVSVTGTDIALVESVELGKGVEQAEPHEQAER